MENNVIKELLEKFSKNEKNVKTFTDILTLSTSLSRELQIADIDEEVGEAVETLIRFWNKYDDELENEYKLKCETEGIVPEPFQRTPIKIYIDSNGGSLSASYTMIDAIRMSKTPVYTINIGCAYSGGFFTFIAGHKRFCYPHASFLYHEGSTGGGSRDAGKFRNFSNFYDRLLEELKNITLTYTKISEEKYKEIQKDDFWFFADEALELGVCDEITHSFI